MKMRRIRDKNISSSSNFVFFVLLHEGRLVEVLFVVIQVLAPVDGTELKNPIAAAAAAAADGAGRSSTDGLGGHCCFAGHSLGWRGSARGCLGIRRRGGRGKGEEEAVGRHVYMCIYVAWDVGDGTRLNKWFGRMA